jgi:hypothetical protein
MGLNLHLDAGSGRTNRLVYAYCEMLERFAALAKREGDEIVAFRPGKTLHFAALDAALQRTVLERFRHYVSVCEAQAGEGLSLREERQLFWRAIQRFGLRPPSDLFSHLEDGDVFEIYEVPEFVQTFRSYAFYRFCSYSLDDLLCRPWWELYMRDQAVSDRLLAVAQSALASRPPAIVHYDMGTHELDEIDSEDRLHCVIESRFVAPLMDRHGRVAALANVARAVSIEPRQGATRR